MELDISKVVRIDSQVEKPIYDRYSSTQRSTCKSITNEETIPNIEAIKVITDLTEDLEKMPTKDVCEKYTEVIPTVIEHCEGTIFDDVDIKLIETEEELKKYLSDVIVRFDTSPKYYTKEDYASLLRVLYRSLLYIYQETSLGPNFSKVAEIKKRKLDLLHPVATDESNVPEEERDSTLVTVSYVEDRALKWEEITCQA